MVIPLSLIINNSHACLLGEERKHNPARRLHLEAQKKKKKKKKRQEKSEGRPPPPQKKKKK